MDVLVSSERRARRVARALTQDLWSVTAMHTSEWTSLLCKQVLLLDEVTVDMDVVGRLDLLAFFEEECAARGATILYATHIFDGLARWATHLALVEDGRLVRGVCPGAAGVCALTPAPACTGLVVCPHAVSDNQHDLLACCVQTGSVRAWPHILQTLWSQPGSLNPAPPPHRGRAFFMHGAAHHLLCLCAQAARSATCWSRERAASCWTRGGPGLGLGTRDRNVSRSNTIGPPRCQLTCAPCAGGPVGDVPELRAGGKLLCVVEAWLRSERERRRAAEAADPLAKALRPGAPLPRSSAPAMPMKHMMFFRG